MHGFFSTKISAGWFYEPFCNIFRIPLSMVTTSLSYDSHEDLPSLVFMLVLGGGEGVGGDGGDREPDGDDGGDS